jgi:COMPASS component SWD3
LKFLPENNNVLISGSWDTNVTVWDIREKKSVGSFIGGRIAGDSIDYKNG